jgi:hypothetical protein
MKMKATTMKHITHLLFAALLLALHTANVQAQESA